MKRAFITGGTGQIGRHLVSLLVDNGFQVKVLVRDDEVPWKANENISAIRGDILDKGILAEGVRGCDYVFHLAVYHNHTELDRRVFYSTNVLGTENLLNACLNANIKKVVNVSSIVVFQSTGKVERNEKWDLRQDAGTNFYALTKMESLVKTRKLFAETKGKPPLVTVFPSVVIDLKDFHSSAPNRALSIQKFIWENIGGGIPGGVINLIGKGDRIINYVVMEDLVKGMLLAALQGKDGEEYILGGENVAVRDYLKASTKRVGKSVFPFRIPAFPFKALSLFDRFLSLPPIVNLIAQSISYDMFFSSVKAEMELGYKPSVKL